MNSRSHRWSLLLEVAILLAAVVLFYPRVGPPGWMSPGGDMVNLMLPAREWAATWLGRGIVPLWNPQTFGGGPFHGAMQAAVFYPPNLVLGAFLTPLATINALRLIHICLFGLLTWMFLRFERGHCAPAALLGGLAVAGSAHVASHTDHINQLAAMAWLPALVACQWRFWRTGSRGALLAFAVVLALQVLAGHPQAVFYSLLLNGAIAAAWVLRGGGTQKAKGGEGQDAAEREGPSGAEVCVCDTIAAGRRVGRLMLLGAAVVGGFLLSSIQLAPTAETAKFSRRSIEAPEYPYFGASPARALLTILEPRAFGDPLSGYTDKQFGAESGAFVGRMTLLMAVVALVAGVARRRGFAVFWTAVVAAALILALGPYGPFHGPGRPSPVFEAYLAILPPARHLRVPPRILLLATFGMAILGAEGIDYLSRDRRTPSEGGRRRVRLLAGWAAIAVLVFELWWFQRSEYHNLVVRHRPASVFLSGPAREPLMALAPEPSPETTLADFRVFRLMIDDPDYLIDSRPAAVRNRYGRLQPNLGMLLGVADVEGYEEGLLPPVRHFDFLNFFNRNLRNPNPDAVLLALMNVKYLYVEHGLVIQSPAWRAAGVVLEPGLAPGEPDRRYSLYENRLYLPRVIWADWLPEQIATDRLRGTLSRGGPPSERMNAIQRYGSGVEALAAGDGLVEPALLATLGVRSIEPNRIVVDNPGRRGGDLIVSQNVYPGWLVEAGDQTAALRSLTDFSGVANVPPGAERIDIVYRPFSFRIGAYLSGLALAVWLALAIVGRSPKTTGAAPAGAKFGVPVSADSLPPEGGTTNAIVARG